MENITPIITAVFTGLTDLAVMPYILAGSVVSLVGKLIMSAKKAGR